MYRVFGSVVIVMLLLNTRGFSQPIFVGPGSTVEGDYLRGVGVASYGIGLGNLYNAQATAIYTDTWIRLNEYIAAVLKNENAENAAHRHAKLQKEHDAYNKMRETNPQGSRGTRRGQGLVAQRPARTDERRPDPGLYPQIRRRHHPG